MPETYEPAVLKQKAKWLRKQEGSQKFKSKMEIDNKSLVKAIGHFCSRPFSISLLPSRTDNSAPVPRTNLFSPLSIYRLPPLNPLPLLRSLPPGLHDKPRLPAPICRPLLPRLGDRRIRRHDNIQTYHQRADILVPPRQEP